MERIPNYYLFLTCQYLDYYPKVFRSHGEIAAVA